MLKTLFLLGLFMQGMTYQKSYSKDCFSEHIRESIGINTERKAEYGKLTDGESDKIFNLLIGYEHLTLIIAKYYDLKARYFQKRGVPLFCHEFMSMNNTPLFQEKVTPPEEEFIDFDWKSFKKEASNLLKKNKTEELKELIIDKLLFLKEVPSYYCMTRHLLESIYRIVFFMEIREEESRSLNIKKDPKKILKSVAKSHLLAARDSYKVDKLSYPIQKRGIPLLCSELPNLLNDLNDERLNRLR